jgi:hypothetical protein
LATLLNAERKFLKLSQTAKVGRQPVLEQEWTPETPERFLARGAQVSRRNPAYLEIVLCLPLQRQDGGQRNEAQKWRLLLSCKSYSL